MSEAEFAKFAANAPPGKVPVSPRANPVVERGQTKSPTDEPVRYTPTPSSRATVVHRPAPNVPASLPYIQQMEGRARREPRVQDWHLSHSIGAFGWTLILIFVWMIGFICGLMFTIGQ